MTERHRASARAHGLMLTAALAVVGPGACANTTGGGGGRAEFTVTYTPDDGGPQVIEQIVVEAVHCSDFDGFRLYGEQGADTGRVTARTVDPSGDGDTDLTPFVSFRFGEDLQFLSTEPFTSDANGFQLDDHPGQVTSIGEEPEELVATDATASGTFTC